MVLLQALGHFTFEAITLERGDLTLIGRDDSRQVDEVLKKLLAGTISVFSYYTTQITTSRTLDGDTMVLVQKQRVGLEQFKTLRDKSVVIYVLAPN